MSVRSMLLIALLAAVIWFALLGYRDLAEPDEGRYSEIPREMVESGDWITPRNNGIKFFEKPVLHYWATAVVFTFFGESNATARLWVALIGFLGGLWVWYVGARLYGRLAGFLAFIATVTGLLYIAFGHTITLDMAVSVFTAAAVTSVALAQSKRGDHAHVRKWMLVAWAAMGLATLSKGLIGIVLPAGAVVAYAIWQRDWGLWRHLHIGKGVLVYLAITAPWFVMVGVKNPEFTEFFFVHEHFTRYTTAEHRRDEPFWFFIPILLFGFFPWTYVTLKQLFRPGFAWRSGSGFDADRFLWTFVLVVVVFFTLGGSKMTGYILPIFPILAILAGKHLAHRRASRVDAWAMVVLAVTLVFGALFGQHFVRESDLPVLQETRPWLIGAAVVMVLAAVTSLGALRRGPVWIALTGLLFMLATQMVLWGYQAKSVTRSSRQIAEAIAPCIDDDTEIYSLHQELPHTLPFYLGRTVTIVKTKGELAMGIDLEPDLWLPSVRAFIELWNTTDNAVAVIGTDYYDYLLTRGLEMIIIYREPGRLAITKQLRWEQYGN